jgi:hypothetical protein
MSNNQQTVKYVKLTDSPGVLEVKGIATSFEEHGTAYMLEAEKGLIEPYSERLVERKFSNYADVAHYLYEEEIRLQNEEEAEMNTTSSSFIHDTIYNALNLIQDLRDANLEIDIEIVKKHLNEKVSNDFIGCVIRFEAEIQAIVAKKMVWEPETPQPDPVEKEAFYQATGKDAPLGRYQIAAGAIQHPDTGLWQVWLSTNGLDFSQLAAFSEESKALNAVSLIKLEAQSGTFYDEELVIDFYLFLKAQSDGKALPLPDDLVRKLGHDILHAIIDIPQA